MTKEELSPRWHVLATIGALALLAACGSTRFLTKRGLLDRQEQFLREYNEDIVEMDRRSLESLLRMSTSSSSAATHLGKDDTTYDILSLSGGGAFGAFGIGVLTGWGDLTEASVSRPRFDSVSGISTGALIAPFAFLGTDEAYAEIAEVYRNPGRDWARRRGLLSLLTGVSLFNASKLHASIRESVTPEIVRQLAQGYDEGNQLQVGATNIDYGLMRVWDLSKIAHEDEPAIAERRIEDVLIASAAIPGVFPPVKIDDLLYVDGGATLQMLTGLGERNWSYSSATESSPIPGLTEPVRIRIWVIVNQKLLPDPKVIRPRWTSIGVRSLSTLVRSSTLQSLQDLETYARLLDRFSALQVEFRYVAIPQSFDIPNSDEMFDAEVMKQLFDLGVEAGKNPASWRTEALRPGAPFRGLNR